MEVSVCGGPNRRVSGWREVDMLVAECGSLSAIRGLRCTKLVIEGVYEDFLLVERFTEFSTFCSRRSDGFFLADRFK
jgi:hypothetical protein